MAFLHSLVFFLFAVFSTVFISYGNADECKSGFSVLAHYISLAGKDVNTQYELGMIYAEGQKGVPQDSEKALYWLERAAKSDHILAQYELGTMYAVGEKVPQNLEKAVRWYENIARINDGSLSLFQKDDSRSHNQKVVLVQSLARYNLGVMYAEGKEGFRQDLKRAFLFLTHAAKSGSIRAERYLEKKVRPEGEKMVQVRFKRDLDSFLQKLQEPTPPPDIPRMSPDIDQLIENIRFHLGVIFALGLEGVPRDFGEAVHWLEQAVVNYAIWNLDMETQIAIAERMAFYLYSKGIGVPQDSEKARAFYNQSEERITAVLEEKNRESS